jgi:hypothetical protein
LNFNDSKVILDGALLQKFECRQKLDVAAVKEKLQQSAADGCCVVCHHCQECSKIKPAAKNQLNIETCVFCRSIVLIRQNKRR